MDGRVAIKNGTILKLTSRENVIEFYIGEVIGMGGSSIVYKSYYFDNNGNEIPVYLKEFYPYNLSINRDEYNHLVVSDEDKDAFKEEKEKQVASYNIICELINSRAFDSAIPTVKNIYYENNTVYMAYDGFHGTVLSQYKMETAEDVLFVVKQVARTINELHRAGYLYLDIKPENISVNDKINKVVQLFDFDSLIKLEDIQNGLYVRISYSQGFSALEQRLGDLKHIGKHSDIYGIGALLFYLIFGKTPSAEECDLDAVYDFSMSKYVEIQMDKTLMKALNSFFHNTIPSFYLHRYKDVDDVILSLNKMDEILKSESYQIICNPIISSGFYAGREQEERELHNWLSSEYAKEQICFVIGDSGIGKSAFVRHVLKTYSDQWDHVIYLYFKDDIVTTITDDNQIGINGVTIQKEETTTDYFSRKIKDLRNLFSRRSGILVIDDYENKANSNLFELMKINIPIVIISNKANHGERFKNIIIGQMDDKALYDTFCYHYNRQLSEDDECAVREIIKCVGGHTLAVEALAKELSKDTTDLGDVLKSINKGDFLGVSKGKIIYEKDMLPAQKTSMKDLFLKLFSGDNLSKEQKGILKQLCMFNNASMKLREAQEMLGFENSDEFELLVEWGWIEDEIGAITIHSIKRAVISSWDNTEYDFALTKQVVNYLLVNIAYELGKEDIPFSAIERYYKVNYLANNNKLFRRKLDKKNNDPAWQVARKRVLAIDDLTERHVDLLRKMVIWGRDYLEHVKNNKENSCISYEDVVTLSYCVLRGTPIEDEDYIITTASDLLSKPMRSEATVEILDKLMGVYSSRNDSESMYELLEDNRFLVFAPLTSRSAGLAADWHIMAAQYYDCKMNGSYTESSKDYDEYVLHLRKSIRYINRLRSINRDKRLGRAITSLATVLIRHNDKSDSDEIKKLMVKAEQLVDDNSTDVYSEDDLAINLMKGWYYTLFEVDAGKVKHYATRGEVIATKHYESKLDCIDFFYIPAADMMCNVQEYYRSLLYLKKALDICDDNIELYPYKRKRKFIIECMNDVYSYI